MRYQDFREGIPMGAKALSTPSQKKYTVGFEFEVAVDQNAPQNSYDNYDDISDLLDEFSDWWYNGNSTFDFEDWFRDNYLRRQKDLKDFLEDNNITPRFGIASTEDQANIDNQKQGKKSQHFTDILKTAGVFEDVTELLNLFAADKIDANDKDENFIKLIYYYTKFVKNKTKSTEQIKAALQTTPIPHESLLAQYADELMNKLNFIKKNLEDYDEDEMAFWADEDNTEYLVLDDISDVDDLTKYFDVDVNELRDNTENEWSEAENQEMNYAFDSWVSSRQGSGNRNTPALSYVSNLVSDEFNTRVASVSSSKSWAVVPDGTPGVDAEITSPAFNIDQGIQVLTKMLKLISDNEFLTTIDATGLHINIGTFTPEEANNVDWLKFLTILNAKRVLQKFNRVYNTNTPDKLPRVVASLKKGDLANYMTAVQSINPAVRKLSDKYSAINLSKLDKYGTIEFRAPGNEEYETQGEYLIQTIKKIVRALEIASNPESYKAEYLNMLYKMIDKKEIPDTVSNIDQFFSKTLNVGFNKYEPIHSIVLAIKRNRNQSDLKTIDSSYTLAIHKELTTAIDNDLLLNDSNGVNEISEITNALNKNNTLASSKFVKLIIKFLRSKG
jgi:hypothetical protein